MRLLDVDGVRPDAGLETTTAVGTKENGPPREGRPLRETAEKKTGRPVRVGPNVA